MATRRLLRRGTAAEVADMTPAEGELVYATDTKQVFIGDGDTPGGNPVGIDRSDSAFIATSDQAIDCATSVFTKLPMNVKLNDPRNEYDASNYRYTPKVAGVYSVFLVGHLQDVPSGTLVAFAIYKNGNHYLQAFQTYDGGGFVGMPFSCRVPMDGDEDYIEAFVYHDSGSDQQFYGASTGAQFSAKLGG